MLVNMAGFGDRGQSLFYRVDKANASQFARKEQSQFGLSPLEECETIGRAIRPAIYTDNCLLLPLACVHMCGHCTSSVETSPTALKFLPLKIPKWLDMHVFALSR